MITTPIAHHCVPTSRALSSMPASAITTVTAIVVNQWLGGGLCGNEGTGSSNASTSFGFASKRIIPGRLEGMT